MTPSDPLIWTAMAYYVIGGVVLLVSAAVLASHPVNRAFFLGAYFTPEGARILMKSWPMVSLFGLFIFSCAVEHHLHWMYEHGHPSTAIYVLFMGWIEAGISLITAFLVLLGVVMWRVKKWKK